LRQRELAKDVPGYPGVVGITAKGMRELDARLGLTPKDLDEARRHFRRYSDNQHQGPFNPHITGALLRRFVGKNLAGKDILDIGCVDWDHLVNPRQGTVKPLTSTLMMKSDSIRTTLNIGVRGWTSTSSSKPRWSFSLAKAQPRKINRHRPVL